MIRAMLYVLQARTMVLLRSRVDETSAMIEKQTGPTVRSYCCVKRKSQFGSQEQKRNVNLRRKCR